MEIQSMTGFGDAENRGFRVEARSVNHRFMDIHFRMPYFLNPYEMHLRNILKEYFSRGRFDITVTFTEDIEIKIGINRRLAASVIKALKELKEAEGLEESPGITHLFWFRDSIFQQEPDFSLDALEATFREALEKLREMRIKEGLMLVEGIYSIIDAVEEIIKEIEELSSESVDERFKELKEKVQRLIDNSEIDETRLLQEIAFMAEKADISEELSRLKSHIKQLRDTLKSGPSVGRKLDFILQECFREINTIGSKSTDYRISERVVKVKTEIEKIREQAQNLQ